MKNNGIFLRATQCKTVKQTDILHCAINHAETLPLKVKEPNEVNEDLTILLTTTMNCKRNQNLVIHIAVLRDESHYFSGSGAGESAIPLYRGKQKNVRVVPREPPRASPRALDHGV
jgi:hypothetical protein